MRCSGCSVRDGVEPTDGSERVQRKVADDWAGQFLAAKPACGVHFVTVWGGNRAVRNAGQVHQTDVTDLITVGVRDTKLRATDRALETGQFNVEAYFFLRFATSRIGGVLILVDGASDGGVRPEVGLPHKQHAPFVVSWQNSDARQQKKIVPDLVA